ncbi:hypothetical protein LMH73_024845 [Vibrio splendidus]|nr:hypothetical protein [Vibrio splendidus]MCC4880536.1 hypothetical protein [Vibrio splendidus]
MYDFKYGVIPSSAEDKNYCQLKGDSGLYCVDEINLKAESVTISSIGAYMTRDREVKRLKNIRFISDERYQLFIELTKQAGSIDDECKPGASVTNIILPNTDGLRFVAHHALLGMSIGNMTLNDTYILMLANEKDEWLERAVVKMELAELLSYLDSKTSANQEEAEAHIHALSKGVFLSERYELFDPLWSKKPTTVIITSATRDSIRYKAIDAKGVVSKVEKILNSRHSKFLSRK